MQIAVVLFQQVAQPADHLVRPVVVRDDIGQDLADLVEVGFLLRQESLGGLGIAQDGGERLVEFAHQGLPFEVAPFLPKAMGQGCAPPV